MINIIIIAVSILFFGFIIRLKIVNSYKDTLIDAVLRKALKVLESDASLEDIAKFNKAHDAYHEVSTGVMVLKFWKPVASFYTEEQKDSILK